MKFRSNISQRTFYLSMFAGALGAVVACSSSDSTPDTASGPPPTDPLVYEASAGTKQDVGIAKWGFQQADGNAAVTIFRGYDQHNTLLVEIKQTISAPDPFTKRFVMEMTGKLASGKESIDYVAGWTADQQGVEYSRNVIENTFVEGSIAARVLGHLAPDAIANERGDRGGESALTNNTGNTGGGNTGGGGGLVKQNTPGLTLVNPGDGGDGGHQLLQCTCQRLTSERAAMSAIPGTECGRLVRTGQSVIGTRALGGLEPGRAGEDADDLDPLALVAGSNGQPTVQSPWNGKYHIVDHHCHNAAAQNSSATDGYIGCTRRSSTTQDRGHTINWGPDPTRPPSSGHYCAYEPQANNGDISSKSVCCWRGGSGADGAPLLNTTESQECVAKLCLGQASFTSLWSPLTWFIEPPRAFPAGSRPQVPNDCPTATTSLSECNTCCTEQADRVHNLFGKNPTYAAQVTEYRQRCATGCTNREMVRNPPPDPCLPSILERLRPNPGTKACGGETRDQ